MFLIKLVLNLNIFSWTKTTSKKMKTVNIELDIVLTNDEPFFHKPRRISFAELDIVDAQVNECLLKKL